MGKLDVPRNAKRDAPFLWIVIFQPVKDARGRELIEYTARLEFLYRSDCLCIAHHFYQANLMTSGQTTVRNHATREQNNITPESILYC